MTRTRTAIVGLIAAVAAVAAIAIVVLQVTGPSDNRRTVDADPAWISYLPVAANGVEPVIHTMTRADRSSESDSPARRVDLTLPDSDEVISLCFGASQEDASDACGGNSRPLGRVTRDVDLPWVAQLGTTEANLLDHLKAPIPTVDDVPSLND